MSNYGLEVTLREAGIDLLRTPVGDRYVVEEMRRRRCLLGGEQSGHIVFLDFQTTGDGIVTALQVLSVMKRRGSALSRLAGAMKRYPQVLVNVPVKVRADLGEFPELASAVAREEEKLGQRGRVLVRFSGTEAKVRVMVEGSSRRQIEAMAARIAGIVARLLGGSSGEGKKS
jgi:phosphoglucosamine mutase